MFAAGKTSGASAGGGPADPQFNYVSMLLHGDGTNGAKNNTFIDSSSIGATVTRNGNTTQGSFSPFGSNWSNYFVKTASSYVSFPQSSAYSFGSGDFTIEGWLFVSGLGSVNCGFLRIGGAFALTLFNDQGQTNELCLFVDSPRLILQSNANISSDTWTYFAVSKSSGTYNFYINGTRVRQVADSTSWTCSSTVLVGTNINGNEFFPGYLSNLRVSNTALYTGSTLTVPTTPLTSSGSTVLLTCQSNRFVDNSSNAFTATASGTPSVQRFNPFGTATAYSTSVIGGSGYFDGTGDYLSVPTGTGLNLTGDFTIEGWIYVDSSNYYTTIFSNGEYPSTAQVVLVVTDGNQPILYMSNGTVWSVTLSSSISLNKNSWNHLAATASGTNYTIWVNGVSGGTVGTGFTRTTADTTSVVGRLYTVTNNYYTKGYISNVRVVKGTALYTTTFTPSTTPLTAVSGTSLLLNYINGAIFDNAMINDLETVDNAQISTSVVKFGTGSLKFDGGGDYLIGASTPNTNIDGGNFTLEAWVYLSDATQVSPIIAKNFGGAGGYMFWVQSTLRLRVYDSSASATTVTSSASISNNTWTFVAVVRNSDTLTLYINGVADGTASYSSTSTNSAAIEVGGYGSGTASMNGYLDEVRITKGYARYTATFTPPTAAFPNTGPV